MDWLRPEGGPSGKPNQSAEQPLLRPQHQPYQVPQSHYPRPSYQPPQALQAHQPFKAPQRQGAQSNLSFLTPENNCSPGAPSPTSGHQPSFSSKNNAIEPQNHFLQPEKSAPLSGWLQPDKDAKTSSPRERTARSAANKENIFLGNMKDHGWGNCGDTALASEITSAYPTSDHLGSYETGSNFLRKLNENEEPKSYPPLIGSPITSQSRDGPLTSTIREFVEPVNSSKKTADENPVAKGRTAITLDAVGNLLSTTLRVLDIVKHCLRPVMEDFVAEPNPVDTARDALRAVKRNLDSFHDSTILLMGPPSSGKTSLAYCFTGLPFLETSASCLPIRWTHDSSQKTATASIPEPLCALLRAWSCSINQAEALCDFVEGDGEVIKCLESCSRILLKGRSSGSVQDDQLSEICQAENLKDYCISVQRDFGPFAPNDMDHLTFLELPSSVSTFTQVGINALYTRALGKCRGCFYVVDAMKRENVKSMPEPLLKALENGTLAKQNLYIIVNQFDLLPGLHFPSGLQTLIEQVQLDFHILFSETAPIENVVPFSTQLFLLSAAGRIRYEEKYQNSGRTMQKTLAEIRQDEIMSKICFLSHGTHWIRKLKTNKDIAAVLSEPEKMLADTTPRLRNSMLMVMDGVCPQMVRLVQASLEREVDRMVGVIETWEAEEQMGVVDEKLEWSFEAFYADVDNDLKAAYKKACPEKSEIESLIANLPENPPYNMPHATFDSFNGIKIIGCNDDVIDYLGDVCFRMIEQWQADFENCFSESVEILRSKLPKWERGLTRLLVKQEIPLTERLQIPTVNLSEIVKEPGKLTTDSAWESFCDVQCKEIPKTKRNSLSRFLWGRPPKYAYEISPTFLANFLERVMDMWISLSTQSLEDMFLTLLDNDLDWVRTQVINKQFIKHDFSFMMELGPVLKKLSSFQFGGKPEMCGNDVNRLNSLCKSMRKTVDDIAKERGCGNQIFDFDSDGPATPRLQVSRTSMYYEKPRREDEA